MTAVDLTIDEHPLLRAGVFVTEFPAPLGSLPSPAWLVELLRGQGPAPFQPDDELRAVIRDLLRHGGYKPTGRGKPASEYLVRAVSDAALSSINPAVDACNVTSLYSGLPISVVDLDRAQPPFRIAIAAPGESYVFNSAGQEIGLAGLLCLFDASGPCANAVKDSKRTKTQDTTTRTLSVVWGSKTHDQRLHDAVLWYRDLLHRLGAATVSDE